MKRKVVVSEHIQDGVPVIEGTDVPAAVVLSYLSSGCTVEGVLEKFPVLTREDVMEALGFAAAVLGRPFTVDGGPAKDWCAPGYPCLPKTESTAGYAFICTKEVLDRITHIYSKIPEVIEIRVVLGDDLRVWVFVDMPVYSREVMQKVIQTQTKFDDLIGKIDWRIAPATPEYLGLEGAFKIYTREKPSAD